MTKIALVLAIVAIGEGAVTLHLVRQVQLERENAQTLQARVAELEQRAPQAAPGATFIAVPTQPTTSPFAAVEKKKTGPAAPAAPVGRAMMANSAVAQGFVPLPAPDQERMREQFKANMERQQALLRDPEYREGMLAQQKLGLRQSSPNLARDLDLTPEQADRLFTTLAEQQMRSMENTSPVMWGEQPDPAKLQEMQQKMLRQQSANETELKRVLGEAKYREYQEYQSLSGVRWEADRVRASLANAGVPLDESLTKPLLKTLQEQQQKMLQQMAANSTAARNGFIAAPGLATAMVSSNGPAQSVNVVEMQEKSVELMAQHQKRQREALARVLSPEQLKIVEDEHNAQLQMQRAQIRMMRAQQEAGLLDQSGNSIGYVQGDPATFTPSSD